MSTEEFAQRAIAEHVWGNQALFRGINLACAIRIGCLVVAVRVRDPGWFQVYHFRIWGVGSHEALDVQYVMNTSTASTLHKTLESAMSEYMSIIASPAW